MAWKYEIEHVEYSGSQGFYLHQLASVREISQILSYNIKKMLVVDMSDGYKVYLGLGC